MCWFTYYTSFCYDYRSKDSSSSQRVEPGAEVDLERMPLFHQPGKQGYYAPLLGSGSTTRLNAFRNVGRFVFPHVLPTYHCNHLLKSHNQLDLLVGFKVILLGLV